MEKHILLEARGWMASDGVNDLALASGHGFDHRDQRQPEHQRSSTSRNFSRLICVLAWVIS
jgi:hypothetical protein